MIAEEPQDIDSAVVEKIIDVGILHSYPIVVGATLRDMMDLGFRVERKVFDKFATYLDNCKGYNNDAKKFREKWD